MLPKKLLQHRLKVGTSQCVELGLSDWDGGRGDDETLAGASRGTTPLNLADQPNPVGNLLIVDEPAGSGEEDDEGLLEVSEDEEDIPPSCVHHTYIIHKKVGFLQIGVSTILWRWHQHRQLHLCRH